MFHKSQTVVKNNSKGLIYQNMPIKIAARKGRSTLKSPLSTKKKINKRVHSSFTVCDEIYSPHSRIRSTSVDRKQKKTASFDYASLRKNHQIHSFQKFDERVFQLINLGRQEIQKGKFSEAISYFTQAIEIDSKCLEALYNKGLGNMLLGLYKEATIDFLNVLRENVLYNKDVYLKLAMCFRNMNDINTALRYITQGLHRYLKYYEGYLYRGQIYNELKQFEKAMDDFKKVLSSNSNEGKALVGIAESLEGIGDLETAIKMLDEACNYPETSQLSLLKKAILKTKNNDNSALNDLEKYLEINPTCPQGFFYKAEFLFLRNQFPESALCYEQCVKYDRNFEYTPRAIFHLGAIKVHEKDFYGALHTFERVGKHEVKDQKVLQMYAEAVINLMKKKYKDGISVFNKLLKRQEPVMKQYIGNCYMYRGYGFNALNLHEKALRSFKKATVFKKLNRASSYNQELSHALLSASKQNFQACLGYLEKCLKIFPKKAEPHVFHAVILVAHALHPFVEAKLLKAEELLTLSMKMREVDSELLFFRSTVRYILRNFKEALEDARLAIDKAEDNIAEQYVLRGLCFAADRSYAEATQDFTIALQLKENLDYVYWYRSRTAYLLDDTTLAFMDLQKFMVMRPNDPEVYYQAAVLLIMGGSYEDALNALTNSISLKSTPQAIYLKAKCFVIMNEINCAIEEMKYFKDGKNRYGLDLEILKFMENAKFKTWGIQEFVEAAGNCLQWSKMETGEIFDAKHILWMQGVFFMYAEDFTSALKAFQEVLEILHCKEGASLSADEALTTEEENCEVLYNIALCHTANNTSQALLILNDLSEILNSKHKGQILLLSAIIQLFNNNSNSAEKLLKEAFICDSDTVTPFLSKKTTVILPLNTSNPFAKRLPLMKFQLSSDPLVKIRPAISLPRSSLPNLEFSVEKEVKEFFTIGKITPRPEAPWLNRVRGSIQFTSTLVDIEEISQISERELMENKTLQIGESEEEFKRIIKSALPLRHFSSFIKKSTDFKPEKCTEEDEILDKIREFCSNKRNSNCEY